MSVTLNVYVPGRKAPPFKALEEQLNARSAAAIFWRPRDRKVGDFERGEQRVHVSVQKLLPALRSGLVADASSAGHVDKAGLIERSETTIRVSAGDISPLLVEVAALAADLAGGVIHDVNSDEFFAPDELRSRFRAEE